MRSTPMPNAKPVHALGVDADVLEHDGMDHPAAEDLDEAGVLAQAAADARAVGLPAQADRSRCRPRRRARRTGSSSGGSAPARRGRRGAAEAREHALEVREA